MDLYVLKERSLLLQPNPYTIQVSSVGIKGSFLQKVGASEMLSASILLAYESDSAEFSIPLDGLGNTDLDVLSSVAVCRLPASLRPGTSLLPSLEHAGMLWRTADWRGPRPLWEALQ